MSKQIKNELNIRSLRTMLSDKPRSETEMLAMAIHNLASTINIVITKDKLSDETKEALIVGLDKVSKDMHKVIFNG